jgi:hypothetical protein
MASLNKHHETLLQLEKQKQELERHIREEEEEEKILSQISLDNLNYIFDILSKRYSSTKINDIIKNRSKKLPKLDVYHTALFQTLLPYLEKQKEEIHMLKERLDLYGQQEKEEAYYFSDHNDEKMVSEDVEYSEDEITSGSSSSSDSEVEDNVHTNSWIVHTNKGKKYKYPKKKRKLKDLPKESKLVRELIPIVLDYKEHYCCHFILIDCNQEKIYDFSEIFDKYLKYDFKLSNQKFTVNRDLDHSFIHRSDLENMIYDKDNLVLFKKKGIYLLIENYNHYHFNCSPLKQRLHTLFTDGSLY